MNVEESCICINMTNLMVFVIFYSFITIEQLFPTKRNLVFSDKTNVSCI